MRKLLPCSLQLLAECKTVKHAGIPLVLEDFEDGWNTGSCWWPRFNEWSHCKWGEEMEKNYHKTLGKFQWMFWEATHNCPFASLAVVHHMRICKSKTRTTRVCKCVCKTWHREKKGSAIQVILLHANRAGKTQSVVKDHITTERPFNDLNSWWKSVDCFPFCCNSAVLLQEKTFNIFWAIM